MHIVNQTCFNKGQEITFQLMKKEKGSTISVPVLEPSRVSNILLPVSETKYTTVYSKLLTVDSENVMQFSSSDLCGAFAARLFKTPKVEIFIDF